MTPSSLKTAQLHRDWLRMIAERSGQSLTAIADEIGVARSTLTRPLKKDDPGTSTLNARTIDKIVAFTGLPPPGSAAPPVARKPTRGLAESDAAPYVMEPRDPLGAAVQALIAGRNGIDPWTIKSRALELAGYLPGDVVLVDLNGTPKPGDAVCAQIYDWPRMKAETVMRVYEQAPPVALLVSRSLDPTVQQPVVIDGERVLVKGVLLPHRLRRAA